jgi:hypothetical protein
MPEKSDTVFMLRAEDGGARGTKCRGSSFSSLSTGQLPDIPRVRPLGPSETSGSEREGPKMDATGTEAAR